MKQYAILVGIFISVLTWQCSSRSDKGMNAVVSPGATSDDGSGPVFDIDRLPGTWEGKNSHGKGVFLEVKKLGANYYITSIELEMYCNLSQTNQGIFLVNNAGLAEITPEINTYNFAFDSDQSANIHMTISGNFNYAHHMFGKIRYQVNIEDACLTNLDSLDFRCQNLSNITP